MKTIILNNSDYMLSVLKDHGLVEIAEHLVEQMREEVLAWGELVYEQVRITFRAKVNEAFETIQAVFFPSENVDPPDDPETEEQVQYIEFQSLEVIE